MTALPTSNTASPSVHDPVYGARPLKRVIQRRVLDPLAIAVLQGQFPEGSHVTASAGANGLTFATT